VATGRDMVPLSHPLQVWLERISHPRTLAARFSVRRAVAVPPPGSPADFRRGHQAVGRASRRHRPTRKLRSLVLSRHHVRAVVAEARPRGWRRGDPPAAGQRRRASPRKSGASAGRSSSGPRRWRDGLAAHIAPSPPVRAREAASTVARPSSSTSSKTLRSGRSLAASARAPHTRRSGGFAARAGSLKRTWSSASDSARRCLPSTSQRARHPLRRSAAATITSRRSASATTGATPPLCAVR